MNTTVCNFVFSFVLLLGGLVSNDVCAGEDRKLDYEGPSAFTTPLAFNKAGKLYIAQGSTIRKAGTERPMYDHGFSICAFAFCPVFANVFAVGSNYEEPQDKEGCLGAKSEIVFVQGKKRINCHFLSSRLLHLSYFSDGTLFGNREANDGTLNTCEPQYGYNTLPFKVYFYKSPWKDDEKKEKEAHSVCPEIECQLREQGESPCVTLRDEYYNPAQRIPYKKGTCNRISAYPARSLNKNLCIGYLGGYLKRLSVERPGYRAADQEVLLEEDDEKIKFIDYAYAPGLIAILAQKKIVVRRIDETQEYGRSAVKSPGIEHKVQESFYNRIELNGGGGLVAIKKQGGADFYSIQNGWLGEDTLVKRPIGIEESITGFAATPSGKTALATERGVTEFDSQTGETINEYGLDGKLTSHNWWRTVRRNVLMPVLGGAAVAGAVVAYSHFQGKK